MKFIVSTDSDLWRNKMVENEFKSLKEKIINLIKEKKKLHQKQIIKLAEFICCI